VCGQFHVAAALTWYRLSRRRGVYQSRPERTGENKNYAPCRKEKHESAVLQFVGCGPAKSCASVCSSNIKHEAVTDVNTKVVFLWDLALKMEAAVLSKTLVLSYETIRLYIPEDSIRRRAERKNSRVEALRLIHDAVQITSIMSVTTTCEEFILIMYIYIYIYMYCLFV
jgi:hypothetical protein